MKKLITLLAGCVLTLNSFAQVGPGNFDGRWRFYFDDNITSVKCGLVITYTGRTFVDQGWTNYEFVVEAFASNCDYVALGSVIPVEGGAFDLRTDGRIQGYFWNAADSFFVSNGFVALDGLTADGAMFNLSGWAGAFGGSKGGVK